MKPASEASAHSELVIGFVVVAESARLKPAHSELVTVAGIVVVATAQLGPETARSGPLGRHVQLAFAGIFAQPSQMKGYLHVGGALRLLMLVYGGQGRGWQRIY